MNDVLRVRGEELKQEKWTIEYISDMETLCEKTAENIAEGKVIGWFQGRMEWGARALGNRSTVCDPRRADMKIFLTRKLNGVNHSGRLRHLSILKL